MKKIYVFLLSIATAFYSFVWLMFTIVFLTDSEISRDIYGFFAFLLISFPLVVLWYLTFKYRKVRFIKAGHKANNSNHNGTVTTPLSDIIDTNTEYERYRDNEIPTNIEVVATVRTEETEITPSITDESILRPNTVTIKSNTELNTETEPTQTINSAVDESNIQQNLVTNIPTVTEISETSLIEEPAPIIRPNQPNESAKGSTPLTNIVAENSSAETITESNIIEEDTTITELNKTHNNETFVFNVAGVTKKNDKNKDIQSLLNRYGKKYCKENFIELYNDYTNKDILEFGFQVFEFEDLRFAGSEITFVPEPTNKYDKNAIKVFIDFGNNEVFHIGYVPKKDTAIVKEIIESKELLQITADYVGGKYKEIDFDFEKDKDIVIINDDLSLGVEIKLLFR